MDDNIINFPLQENSYSFIRCPCKNGGVDYLPVVLITDHPIIVSLVCPECETTIPVVNGIVGDVE